MPDAKLEGFDKLLIGKKAGDTVETKVKISDEADNEALRGKEVDLTLEVVAVEERKLPELTPAFLEKIGGFKDEEELTSRGPQGTRAAAQVLPAAAGSRSKSPRS